LGSASQSYKSDFFVTLNDRRLLARVQLGRKAKCRNLYQDAADHSGENDAIFLIRLCLRGKIFGGIYAEMRLSIEVKMTAGF
jgi:hypothetical protein